MTKDDAIKGHHLLQAINELEAVIKGNVRFFTGYTWNPDLNCEHFLNLPEELTPLINELIKTKIDEYKKQLEEL